MKALVLLPKIFNFPFTYNSNQYSLKTGDFVEVPFGKKNEIGIIWPGKNPNLKNIKIKKINKKIHNLSLHHEFIDFISWFASYNMMPLGLVLKMSIGSGQNFASKKDKNFDQIKKNIKTFYLNEEQKKALDFLNYTKEKFDVSVLQGTTGSGKTLVYFERIKRIINNQKQALVLLPEIFLTNEFKSRFEDFFGFEPAIWHSKITPKKKE